MDALLLYSMTSNLAIGKAEGQLTLNNTTTFSILLETHYLNWGGFRPRLVEFKYILIRIQLE